MVTPNEIPKVFTRATLDQASAAAAPVASVAGAAPAAQGISPDQWLAFGERALNLFQKFQSSWESMRKLDSQGQASPTLHDNGHYQGDPIVMDNPNPSGPAPPAPTPVARGIEAIKVYQVALGAMNKLAKIDPDMTVSAVQELARENKESIIQEIDRELINLTGD